MSYIKINSSLASAASSVPASAAPSVPVIAAAQQLSQESPYTAMRALISNLGANDLEILQRCGDGAIFQKGVNEFISNLPQGVDKKVKQEYIEQFKQNQSELQRVYQHLSPMLNDPSHENDKANVRALVEKVESAMRSLHDLRSKIELVERDIQEKPLQKVFKTNDEKELQRKPNVPLAFSTLDYDPGLGIISFLNQKDIVKLSRTSKQWHNEKIKSDIWRTNAGAFATTEIRKMAQAGIRPLSKNLLTFAQYVETLDLSECKISFELIQLIVKQFPNLKAINLQKTNVIDRELELLTQLKQLQSVNLSFTHGITAQGIEHLEKLPQLRELDLSEMSLNDAIIEHLGKLTKLIKLNLYMCYSITDVYLARLTKLTQLQDLNLVNASITNAGLEHIGKFIQLRHLHLSSSENISDLKYLTTLINLKSLYLDSCQHITDAGLEPIAMLTELCELSLKNMSGITDAGLKPLIKLIQLRYLAASRLTDAVLENIITKLPQLHHLDLENCSGITDTGLAHITNLTQLLHLMLYDSLSITDTGLELIAAKLNQLRTLKIILNSHSRITDAGAMSIAKLTQLRHLVLQLENLTDKGIQHLTKFLPQLLGLTLQGSKITDVGVKSILQLTKLEALDLSLSEITDAALKDIAQLRQLQSLTLMGCRLITKEELINTVSKMNLQITDLWRMLHL